MRLVRTVVLALGLGAAVVGAIPDGAQAASGGIPPEPSCGIGRAEAANLRQLPVKPGAGEAALLPPKAAGCTGK
jgi:hypothetical protein